MLVLEASFDNACILFQINLNKTTSLRSIPRKASDILFQKPTEIIIELWD